ncbi:MAG: DUF1428 domain-containing protein [Pseudomonadota bacterium]
MPFVDGFVAPVPVANKEAYIASAKNASKLFKEFGALHIHECWGVDVPDGEVTSFPMAVKKTEDEVVVLSWIIWPDKETRDTCHAAMDSDPRWQQVFEGGMPFDGKRMIYGGFETLFEV